jgi:hypothetical protein
MRPNQARRKLCSYVGVIARYAAQRTFGVLPPQDMQVGGLSLHKISFVTLAAAKDVSKAKVDGLLPTALFRRVYISYSDRFVVLEPW